MTRAAATLLLTLALPACGDGTNNGTTVSIDASGTGNEENVQISTDADGRAKVKIGGFEGSVTLPKLDIKAEDFDVNGMKLFPGSSIQNLDVVGNDRMGEKDEGRVTVKFTAPAGMDEVKRWFADSLAKSGFKATATADGFSGTAKDGEPFSLKLTDAGADSVKGEMTVGS